MPSGTFDLFHQAILGRKQITCWYKKLYREVCPHILGYKQGTEMAQVYQFAGSSSKGGLPPRGEYRCFYLDKVEDVALRDGPWYGDEKHKQKQRCVDDVYVHIDLSVEHQPGRRREG